MRHSVRGSPSLKQIDESILFKKTRDYIGLYFFKRTDIKKSGPFFGSALCGDFGTSDCHYNVMLCNIPDMFLDCGTPTAPWHTNPAASRAPPGASYRSGATSDRIY